MQVDEALARYYALLEAGASLPRQETDRSPEVGRAIIILLGLLLAAAIASAAL